MAFDYKDVGNKLKDRRRQLKRELKDISDELKTSEDYLSAIEEGNVGALPSAVYYNLFARSYADELGMDSEELLEESVRAEQMENMAAFTYSEKLTPRAKVLKWLQEASITKMGVWMGAAVLFIFTIVVVVSLSGDKTEEPSNSSSVTGAEAKPDSESVLIEESFAETEASGQESMSENISIEESRPEVEGARQMPEQPMELNVNITDSCWILVVADGDTVLNHTLVRGDTRNLRANDRFVVTVALPNNLELKLNDTLLRPLSQTGGLVRNLEINRQNKTDFYYIPDNSLAEENVEGI